MENHAVVRMTTVVRTAELFNTSNTTSNNQGPHFIRNVCSVYTECKSTDKETYRLLLLLLLVIILTARHVLRLQTGPGLLAEHSRLK